MGRTFVLLLVIAAIIGGFCPAPAAQAPISEATQECLECHAVLHPGLVADWKSSRHARTAPATALKAEALQRRISTPDAPADLADTAVGCAECHGLRTEQHADRFEHNGYTIHVVVSPEDCATCHPAERKQYSNNLMSHAYGNLAENPLYRKLEDSMLDHSRIEGQRVVPVPAAAATREEACYSCHGTYLKVTGTQTRDTDLAGELDFPVIAGWPNQGVGRVNPDGSRGACSACHSRHAFSIEMARKPDTCKQCHVGPDVPIYKVYAASKHGNIYASHGSGWNFDAVPWKVGEDFTAPTCAACHASLLVDSEGEVVSERTHQMNERLPWRLFGLVYAHPHPLSPDTTVIRSTGGLTLPTDLSGRPAESFLISPGEQQRRQDLIQRTCLACHDSSWVAGHWSRMVQTLAETNDKTRAATELIQRFWEKGLARGLDQGQNPFDEMPEKLWSDTWLFYANTVRFASAMGCGGDFGVFANGRYHLNRAIRALEDRLYLAAPASARSE